MAPAGGTGTLLLILFLLSLLHLSSRSPFAFTTHPFLSFPHLPFLLLNRLFLALLPVSRYALFV